MPSLDMRRMAARALALAPTQTLLATLALLASVPIARAVPPLLPNLLFNVTLSSMSLLWDYSDVPAWSTNFSDSDPSAAGTVGRGQSVAWVTGGSGAGVEDASMFLCQQGTALYVYGSVSVAPGQSDADKVLYWAGDEPYKYIPAMVGDTNTLLYQQGDSWRWFCNALYARPNMGLWSINGITVTTGMETDAPTFADVNYETVPFVAFGELNRDFTFSGEWQVSSKLGDVDYMSATGTFTATQPRVVTGWVPDNTSFVVVRGVMGPGYDKVNIHLNPEPGPPYEIPDNNLNRNTSSEWYMPDAVLYFRPIDPTVQYRMSIGLWPNSPRLNKTIGLSSVTYCSALWNGTYGGNTPGIQDFQNRSETFNSINTRTPNNGTGGNNSSDPNNGVDGQGGTNDGNSPGKSKTNIGAIAGGVVGGVLAIVLVAVAFFLWRRRKRSGKGTSLHGPENSGMFEVDSDVPTPHPFVARPGPPMPTRPDLPSPALDTHTVDGSEKRALAHAEAAALVSPLIFASQTTLPSPNASPPEPAPEPLASPPTDLLSPATHAPQLQTPRPRPTPRPEPPTRKPTVRAVDGGAPQDVEVVPPLYDPSWLGSPTKD